MKTKLLLTNLFFILCCGIEINKSKAQITLTSADVLPIGHIAYIASDTTLAATSFVPGIAGTNQTWNFNSLQNSFIDTLSVVDPTNTPYSSSFPSSNYAHFYNHEGIYVYEKSAVSGFYEMGESVKLGDPGHHEMIKYCTPNIMSLTFPCTYGILLLINIKVGCIV